MSTTSTLYTFISILMSVVSETNIRFHFFSSSFATSLQIFIHFIIEPSLEMIYITFNLKPRPRMSVELKVELTVTLG